MSLISLAVTLIVIGVLLWLVNTYIPMNGKIKKILNAVVVICVVVWLLFPSASSTTQATSTSRALSSHWQIVHRLKVSGFPVTGFGHVVLAIALGGDLLASSQAQMAPAA